jgi:hypothetical protein
MGIAGFAGARLTREDGGKRAGGLIAGFVSDGAGSHALESGLNGGQIIEGVKAVGAAAEFAGGLRTAKHKEAEDSSLVAAKIEDGADAMFVLGDSSGWFSEAVADRGDEGEVFKRMEGLADFFFCEIEDRVAAGALVAGVKQGVEGEGVVLWRGDLFLDERAEDAELMGREMHGLRVPQIGGWWDEGLSPKIAARFWRRALVDGVEGSLPARFADEVCELVEGEAGLLGETCLVVLVF